MTRGEQHEIERQVVKEVFGCKNDELSRQSVGLQAQRGIEEKNIDEYIENLQFDPDQDGCESVKSQSSEDDEKDYFGTPLPNNRIQLDGLIEDFDLEMNPEHNGYLSKDLRSQSKPQRCTLLPFCFSEQSSPDRDLYLRTSAPLPKVLSDHKGTRTDCFSDTRAREDYLQLQDFDMPPPPPALCRYSSQTCNGLSKDPSRTRLLSEPVTAIQAALKVEAQSQNQACQEGDPSITSSTAGSAHNLPEVSGGERPLQSVEDSTTEQQITSCF